GLKSAGAAAAEIRDIYEQTDVKLKSLVTRAISLAKELNNPRLVANLELLKGNIGQVSNRLLDADQINRNFTDGFVNGIESFIRGTATMGEAMRKFASDFLAQIAKMIIQQLIFNAISGGTSGGGGGGWLSGVVGNVSGAQYHDGGVVGTGGDSRMVNPLWFTNAMRYHSGGIAGLKPNEVPSVLEKGEEVLTRDDPRHKANGGGGNNQPLSVKVVNAIDSASVVSEGLNTSGGQKSILNFMRANKKQIKSVLS
ncbi:MAG: hypothetical protein RI637_10620, partial [Acidimicrobiia bacterium]|nr:hypothetical protein [Acidimicrobiia bacterium]